MDDDRRPTVDELLNESSSSDEDTFKTLKRESTEDQNIRRMLMKETTGDYRASVKGK